MNKRTKKITLAIISLILLLVVGFMFTKGADEQTVASTEIEATDVEPSIKTKEVVEPASSKKEELDETAVEVAEAKEEETPEEKAPEPEEASEQIEEPEPKPKETPTTDEAEPLVQPKSEKKEETQQSSPKTSTVPKSKEVIPKSTVGMTDYLLPFSNSEERMEDTSHVVLHFSSNALNKPENPYLIEDTYNIFKDYGVSAHYVIDRAGKIYSFVPEDRVAYHAGRGRLAAFPEYDDQLNHYSIGIELLAVGTREEMIPIITAEKFDLIDPKNIGYTEAQYGALNTLLNDIVARHPKVKKDRNHIVGHDEYAPGRKTDPGSLFNWSKIGF